MAQTWAFNLDSRMKLTGARSRVSLSHNRENAIIEITTSNDRRKSLAIPLESWRKLIVQAEESHETGIKVTPVTLADPMPSMRRR